MYKHYIRLNNDNYIIDGYSTAFRDYVEGDICIYEGDKYRHFFLIDNIVNPNLYEGELQNPIWKYKYIDGNVVEV